MSNVPFVIAISCLIKANAVSIVLGNVTYLPERRYTLMSSNIIDYINAMVQAKRMYKMGLINDEEYLIIEDKMAEKYGLNSLSLYRLNDLINKPKRVMDIIQN